MKFKTEVQYCSKFAHLPSAEQFQCWTDCLLPISNAKKLSEGLRDICHKPAEASRGESADETRQIVVRLVDQEEMKYLNDKWRDKPHATNVLAFPAGDMPDIACYPLGDIVICAEVVQSEAESQGKPYIDRFAHIFLHGLLHLLGYDHQLPKHAAEMERVEEEALSRLGYANPYEVS